MKPFPLTSLATVSAWRNTPSTKPSTSTRFALRLGCPLRDAWVTPKAQEIELHLERGPVLGIELSEAFWNKCPEFKHPAIYDWLMHQGITVPWPPGKPPKFKIERISGTVFRVYQGSPTHPLGGKA